MEINIKKTFKLVIEMDQKRGESIPALGQI
jgi:hypothetical protein